MSEIQIRIAIAEACGWKVCPQNKWLVIPPNSPHSVQPLNTLPDYCNDLNAMHEAEGTMDAPQYSNFTDHLYDAECERQKDTKKWRWLSATAAQRAEAFLRAIGKWEEAAK